MKDKIDKIVKTIQSDPKILANFQKNPIKVVESLIGVDLPDDQINGVVEAVKAKINIGNVADKLKGILG